MKKLVVIGGGTGLSVMLRGLKELRGTKLTAIVSVADDGGSTGRLRRQYAIPAMGDIRNVLCAMAEEETLFSQLMDFRFSGEESDIGGHSLGNLLLTSLTEITGSFLEAVQTFSKVLKVKGEVIPASLEEVTLFAEMEDGTLVKGESNIPRLNNHVHRVFYKNSLPASPQALQAIQEADLIIYGIGSLYTSIIPNLILTGAAQALKETTAPKIYFCNVMTQPGETDGYTLEDHVKAIEDHTFPGAVDIVVSNSRPLSAECLQKYRRMGAVPVYAESRRLPFRLLLRDLVREQDGLVRHDSAAIRKTVQELLGAPLV